MRIDRIGIPLAWRTALALAAAALLLREGLATSAPTPANTDDRPESFERLKPIMPPPTPSVTYPAIAAHPVFDTSRQPWTAPALQLATGTPAAVRVAPPPPRGYVLVGLVTGLHQRSAMLRGPLGKTVFLAEGQLLTGWTVHLIDTHGVHFQADGDHFDLAMPPARDVAAARR